MSKRDARRQAGNVVDTIPADNSASPIFDSELSAADGWGLSSERSEQLLDGVYGKSAPAASELEQRIAQLEKHVNKFKVTETGVEVIGNASREDIEMKLREVAHIESAIFWIYGDLLKYAIDSGWENVYDWAKTELDKQPGTLQNYVMVARAFSSSERSEPYLKYRHYEILASVKDDKVRKALMSRCVQEGLTTRALKAVVDQVPLPDKVPSWRRTSEQLTDQWEHLETETKQQAYEFYRDLVDWMAENI